MAEKKNTKNAKGNILFAHVINPTRNYLFSIGNKLINTGLMKVTILWNKKHSQSRFSVYSSCLWTVLFTTADNCSDLKRDNNPTDSVE